MAVWITIIANDPNPRDPAIADSIVSERLGAPTDNGVGVGEVPSRAHYPEEVIVIDANPQHIQRFLPWKMTGSA